MPICTREGFDYVRKKKEEHFKDNDYVFFCEITKQMFRDYEDYFKHVMAINSTVWQCEVTGRENLTYAEAQKSERKARMKIELFKDALRPPVMLIIEHAKQSSLNNLNAIISKFLRRRFFLNEEVTAAHNSNSYNPYKVLEIIPPDKASFCKNTVYDATEQLLYRLKRINGNQDAEIVVPFEKIRRLRQEFTSENLAMFIKDNVTRIDGILRPKPSSFKKYVTDREITFEKLFIGKMPHYTPSKIKPKKVSGTNGKKQLSINKYLVKNGEVDGKENELSAQEVVKKANEKAEKLERAEAKAKSLKEEMERVRREKQEKLMDLERQKAEKREKLLEKVERKCSELLTKTDDLERTDQRLLPRYKSIRTYIPNKYLGDALMVSEFMHSFTDILSGIEVFRNKLSFYELSRAFTIREVAGPLSDIFLILLGTIFDLQKEEEDKCLVEYLKLRVEQRRQEPQLTMAMASKTHFYARRHFSLNINQLPLDAQTVSEVLRLHLLSSGACVKDRTEKWRIMNRNGYTSSEDPGLMLRLENPNILRVLRLYSIYQLPFGDIMSVVHCLISQILTYSTPLAIVEERMEQTAKARSELRTLSLLESKRLSKVEMERKALTCEYHQQCMETEVKDDEKKKKQLEEKLNKKLNELQTQSKRKQREYELQVGKLNDSLFDFMIYLGTDRAYRKYYAFESLPGVFVEHASECIDKCLEKPPLNALDSQFMEKLSTLPKNRKDLRSYLLRMYTKEEKELTAKNRTVKNKNNTLENKENLENVMANGTEDDVIPPVPLINGNGLDKMDITDAGGSVIPPPQPSQYELYMCTGDPNNCIVHDLQNPDRQLWAYIYEKADIDALIEVLNPLGERESQLLEQLQNLRELIINHAKKCPMDKLSLEDDKKINKFRSAMFSETHRNYGQSNFGFPKDTNLNEVMYGTLVSRILQFESDIYTGDLGRLKVKDMEKWRQDVQKNAYEPQVKLQWGPVGNPKSVVGLTDRGERDENNGVDEADDEDDPEVKESGKDTTHVDPGEHLGDSLELFSKDSDDQGAFLQEADTLRQCVKNLSSALLQVEQGIERRFLKEPFGVSNKDIKDKELLERKLRASAERLKEWEVSLMECSSYSQVFLHYNILHDSIIWARSTNKSSCQVCRRGSDPDKMLLCDECNGGTHTFCMKPEMKTVPEGNWYCRRCVTRLGLRNEANDESENKTQTNRKRAFLASEEDHVSESSSMSSESAVRVTKDKRFGKGLKAKEIEELVDGEEEEEYEERNGVNEEEISYKDEETSNDDDLLDEEDDENGEAETNENGFHFVDVIEAQLEPVDDDGEVELVCAVCCYDGSDVTCTRCQDSFHLECIDLKRAPRYNFICNKCKAKDEKKRRKRAAEYSTDDNTDSEEFSRKRSRQMRTSLRNSMPNGNYTEDSPKSSSSRRSHRRTADNLPLNSPVLYDLLDDIMKHELAWPFLRPVLQSEVPDYYKIIKKPMDFAKIKSKLNMGEYQLNEELLKDIQLIFQNCDTYNVEGNEIYNMGSSLEKFVMERCKELNLPFKPSDMNN